MCGLLLLAGPAFADNCKQLAIVTSIDLSTDAAHDAVFAKLNLDGKDEYFLIDTGAALSTITKEAADDLGLDREPVNVALIDVNGRESHEAGRVKSLTLGNLHASNVDFIIMRDNPFGEGNKDVAGLLGADFLSNYDVEIDYGANKLTLLSPDHCPGKVIYWPATAVAAVPITILPDAHIQLPVTLDGKPVSATLDTGASNTTLSRGFADANYGINEKSPGVTVIGELNNAHGSAILSTHFKMLTFGDDASGSISIGNPQVDLIADYQGNSDVQGSSHTGTRLKPKSESVDLPDMLLGMNVLKHLHIYIAYGEGRLYITPASAPGKP
ncbi:MAG TPA: aspartyl protease family protein [Rhizomicrobium sp.]|jgi:predicted aspartyl protease|nr:aspartyl protease family protein [Rhizomicrobium sp.]